MGLTSTTEHTVIGEVAGRVLLLDPVRATQVGSALRMLTGSAWAAFDDERPALLALRSADTHPVMVVGDWTPDEQRGLADLLRDLPGMSGLSGVEAVVVPIGETVHPDAMIAYRQRLFRCDDLVEPDDVPGRAVAAGEAERELVRDWFAQFAVEANGLDSDTRQRADAAVRSGTCLLWLDAKGEPVSMTVQQEAAAGSARIGPVFTPARLRGHGYASAATAAATRAILDDGDVPVLFTDLANPTANRIYRQLGYRAVEDRVIVRF